MSYTAHPPKGKEEKGPLFTLAQIAGRLGVCKATVYNLVSTGRLKVYRVGVSKGYRVSEGQLQEFLRQSE